MTRRRRLAIAAADRSASVAAPGAGDAVGGVDSHVLRLISESRLTRLFVA
jgi:hypothetical protein